MRNVMILAALVLTLAAPTLAQDPPTNVTAQATAPTTVEIAWSAAAGALEYRVQRRLGSAGSWDAVSPNLSAVSYVDATAAPSTTYGYRVGAFHAGGEIATSDPVAVTTPATPREPEDPAREAGPTSRTVTSAPALTQWAVTNPSKPVLRDASAVQAQAVSALALADFTVEQDGNYFWIYNKGSGDDLEPTRVTLEVVTQPPPSSYPPALKTMAEGLMKACDDEKPIYEVDQKIGPIGAGNGETVLMVSSIWALPNISPTNPGPLTRLLSVEGICVWKIIVTADVDGEVTESNESNNQATYVLDHTVKID